MKNKKVVWITIALTYALFAAPNAMVIKAVTNSADAHYWNAIRFGLVFVLCLPFIIRHWRIFTQRKIAVWVLSSALCMTIAVITYTLAISLSLASYVSIITLINPILLVLITPFFTNDRVSRRAMTGLTCAIVGTLVIVLLPIALYQHGVAFYPIATVLACTGSVAFTFALIAIRRSHENGAPLVSVIGITALCTSLVSLALFVAIGDPSKTPFDIPFFIATLYSGVGVGLIARSVSVRIFEHTGAVFTSILTYFENFVTILLPVILLGEQLSFITIAGGVLIVFGMYIVESHKQPHARHHFIWRHH